ncbi:hypothetical protein BJX64DRAFT_67027 [Aspergillus heterothallicus]
MLRGSDSPISPGVPRPEDQMRSLLDGSVFRSLSATEQTQIYKRWVASGKPHNIICSACQRPDNLLHCSTCSRSYHALCLSRSELSEASQFACPPCKTSFCNRSATFSNPSRGSTPIANHSSRITSPSNQLQSPGPRSLQSSRVVTPASGGGLSMFSAADALDPSMLTRAREFLHVHGGFPEQQEFSLELLLKLGSIMTELDYHRQQVQELASENSHLRQDNANIRAYLDSNLATGRPAGTPITDFSPIPRPSADTTGKSWDRIVMDLI